MTARALHFVGPRRVRVIPVELPPLRPGEVLVRTERSGVSGGTELLAYRGEVDPSMPLDEALGALGGTFAYPFAYGYGAVGTVEASEGPVEVGARVFAFHPHQDRFVVDGSDVLPVEHTDPRVATLFPLVETGLQIALDAGACLGKTVVVLGLGAVGILAARLIGHAGANVVGADPRADRRAIAAGFGVEAEPPDTLPDRVSDLTRQRGADLVVEASGRPEALQAGLEILRHEGTVLTCSWYGTRSVALDLGWRFHRRRLTIRSTQVSTIPASLSSTWDRDRRRSVALELLDELPLKLLATHEFPFERAADAYAALDAGEEGLLHAALAYD